jgi:hypothetical protein
MLADFDTAEQAYSEDPEDWYWAARGYPFVQNLVGGVPFDDFLAPGSAVGGPTEHPPVRVVYTRSDEIGIELLLENIAMNHKILMTKKVLLAV